MYKKILHSKLVISLVLLALFVTGLYGFRASILSKIIQTTVGHRLSTSNASYLVDGLHVGLCGAGSQFLVDPKRSEPCALVFAGNQLFVINAGNKSTQIMESMSFGAGEVKAVFLTDFHSYQINGLGQLLNWNWLLSKSDKPLPVFGPEGVANVVSSLNQAYLIDSHFKLNALGDKNLSVVGYGGRPITIQFASNDEVVTISKGPDLEVSAFPINGFPGDHSLGYIFRYKGRSALITGDTTHSPNIKKYAKNIDLLVHDALSPQIMQSYLDGATKSGMTHVAELFSKIMIQHATPEDAASVARDAGVKYLLLTGITPPLQLPGAEGIFLGHATDIYNGPLKIGIDGDMVTMPANSDEFMLRNVITKF
jgi:ribonuclease Z